MTTAKKSLAVAAVFLSAVAFGNAAADPTTTTGVTTTGGGSVADQSAQATVWVARIDQATRRVRKMNDEATKVGQKDAMKAVCLSDKLNQLQALSDSGASKLKDYQSAVSRGDTDLANYDFGVLATLRRRSEQLDAEANQCVGEDQTFSGDTKITVTIDPNIADPPPDSSSSGGGSGGTGTSPTLPVNAATAVQ